DVVEEALDAAGALEAARERPEVGRRRLGLGREVLQQAGRGQQRLRRRRARAGGLAERLQRRDRGLRERPERLEEPVDARCLGTEVLEHRRRLVGEVAEVAARDLQLAQEGWEQLE